MRKNLSAGSCRSGACRAGVESTHGFGDNSVLARLRSDHEEDPP